MIPTAADGSRSDLIKVRLQTHNSSNAFRVVSDIVRNEGPLAFYKVRVSCL
jgi:hypothetical protein